MTSSRNSKHTRILANRYEVIKKLGAGSYGAVYLASDMLHSEQSCVIKEIYIGDLKPDETVGAVNEARLLCKLKHPGIVKFYNSFIDGEYFCIVTEFCEGGDLDVTLKKLRSAKKELDTKLLIKWFIQLLDALSYMHQRNVLHRDLKSKNIFLKDNAIKVGDFGISRILLGTLDQATTFTGTPYYMAPEVLSQEGYNSKSDMWSLGVVLFQMCCLRQPFDGKSLPQVIFNITQGPIPPLPSRFRKELHDIYYNIVSRDPVKRAAAADILNSKFILDQIETFNLEILSKDVAAGKAEAEDIAQILGLPRKKVAVDVCGSPTEDEQFSPFSDDFSTGKCTSQTSPKISRRGEGLTARDKLRYRKQIKADIEAAKLKQVTASLYVENRQNYCNLKQRQSVVAVPFVNNTSNIDNNIGNEEVMSTLDEETITLPECMPNKRKPEYTNCFGESIEIDTILKRPKDYTHCFGGTDDMNSTEEPTIVSMPQPTIVSMPQKSKAEYTHCFGNSEDDEEEEEGDSRNDTGKGDSLEDECKTNRISEIEVSLLSNIPDDESAADTYYSTFDDFERESSNDDSFASQRCDSVKSVPLNDSETLHDSLEDSGASDSYELEAVVDCLESALVMTSVTECSTLQSTPSPPPTHNSDTEIRQQKITSLRNQCVKLLGDEGFQRAYRYLEKARFHSDPCPSESVIMKRLRKIVSNPRDCFLVEQLLFLEKQH